MNDTIGILDRRKRPPFTQIDNKVLESTCLDAYEKLTYIILCKFSNYESQTCFPSLKTLMQLVGCKKPKLIKSLKHLKELQLIDIEKRTNGKEYVSNLYILLDLDGVVIDNYNPGNPQIQHGSNRVLQPGNQELPELYKDNNINSLKNNNLSDQFDTIDDMINFHSEKYELPFENVLGCFDRCIKQHQECNINKSFTTYFETALENEKKDYRITKFIKPDE